MTFSIEGPRPQQLQPPLALVEHVLGQPAGEPDVIEENSWFRDGDDRGGDFRS
jgi:hypothetical protein